jgi:hypothetical protein
VDRQLDLDARHYQGITAPHHVHRALLGADTIR